MKYQILTGSVVSLMFFSAAAGAQSSTEVVPPLALIWHDNYDLLPQGFDRVARDIQTSFAEMGIAVSWDAENTPKSAAVRVQVVLKAADPTSWGLPKHTMGVVIGNKIPRSSVFIFLPNVLRTLGYGPELKRMRPPKEVAFIARGLARVVAHEVIHAVVPEHGHDGGGLLAPKLKRKALTWRHLDLDDATQELLLARLTDRTSLGDEIPLAP